MRRQGSLWLLLFGGGALGVIALARPDLLQGGRGVSLLYIVLLLAYLGGSAWVSVRLTPGRVLTQAVVWLAIFVALAGGYRLWQAWT
jgi:hypothetical protein